MRPRKLLVVFSALAAALAVSGCGDSATAPAPSATFGASAPSAFDRHGSDSNSGSLVYVVPLLRPTALRSALTASRQVGPLGGVLAIPDAGLTVIVPPFALDSVVTISVTARQGDAVAYDFEPHGIRFKVPLVVTQSLRLTAAQRGGKVDPRSLFVGYYPDKSHTTEASELLGVHLDLFNQVAVFDVWHFSGYIFASGRCNDGD